MLLGTLGASLLGNISAGKGVNRAEEGIVRAGYGNKKVRKTTIRKQNGFLMPPHPLTNFEIQKYYQNKPLFNGVYSRYNLSVKIKDGAYLINLNEYSDTGTHWVALYVQNDDVTYFDSVFPKEIKTFISHENIKTNILRIQAYDSTMCE